MDSPLQTLGLSSLLAILVLILIRSNRYLGQKGIYPGWRTWDMISGVFLGIVGIFMLVFSSLRLSEGTESFNSAIPYFLLGTVIIIGGFVRFYFAWKGKM